MPDYQITVERRVRRVLDETQAKERSWNAETDIVPLQLVVEVRLSQGTTGCISATANCEKAMHGAVTFVASFPDWAIGRDERG
jgi:hypothetical protein